MANDKKKKGEVSRRDFLKTTGLVTSGLIGGSLMGGLIGQGWSDTKSILADENEDTDVNSSDGEGSDSLIEARMFFNRKDDFDVLSMATETIYPEDDSGAGAIGLGVPFFIDRQLASPWGLNDRMYMEGPFGEDEIPLSKQEIYIQGLRKIEEESMSEYETSFVDLEEDERVAILESFEAGDVEMDLIGSDSFFQLLRTSTLEGAYSDPIYGGNRGMEGWKMKEYPGAQLSYRHLMNEDHSADSEYIVIEPMSLSSQ